MSSERRKFIGGITILIIGISLNVVAGGWIWYLENAPVIVIKPFEDPFMLNNGTRVSTVEEWMDARRPEIAELVQSVVYGRLPERPDALLATVESTTALDGGGELQVITLGIVPDNVTPSSVINFTLWLFVPGGAGPFPAIVKVSPDGTGTQEFINETIVDRGYIFACFNHTALDPDTRGYDVVGPCQEAYPEYDWGSLAVWAWGAMRVADFLLGEPWVDAPGGLPDVNGSALIVTGHSRRGKTALIAGALDDRFDMVVPNGSGCGGTGAFTVLGPGAETLAQITSPDRFKSWFKEDLGELYANNEKDLPLDQHFMRALVAPRLMLSTDGLADAWANPIGTQCVYEAAQPVFDFLGVPGHNAIHFREGGHGFRPEDFSVLLDFADSMLLGKEIPRPMADFYRTPFDFEAPFNYTTP